MIEIEKKLKKLLIMLKQYCKDEITIKLKDLKVLLERNSNAFKELEEILFAMEMEKRATEVEKGNYELHSLEEMKSLLVEMKKNG